MAVFCLGFALLTSPFADGKEIVTFANGFCFEADSHTEEDGTLNFRVGKGNLQVLKQEISRIEVAADPSPVASANTLAIDELLAAAALQAGLEPEFIKSVAKAESAFAQSAKSPKGAQGLMQLMPATAKELGVDPKIARDNAQGGANYLRQLLLRYHGDAALALAAYNAGSGAVEKYGGVPPFPETRDYIVRVLKEYARLQRQSKRTTSQNATSQANRPTATN